MLSKTSKRALPLILALVMAFAGLPGVNLAVSAQVYSGEAGDDITWTLDTSTGVLTFDGTGPMWDWDWWDTVPWDGHRENITSVVISNGITTVGDYAFALPSSLTSVYMPGVTIVGESAFEGAISLTSVYMPSVTVIGRNAFRATNLTSVDIPTSITTIGNFAFAATSLISATIRSRDAIFGEYVFSVTYHTHPDFAIHGFTGSTAHKYAIHNEHNFVPLDDSPSGWAVEQVNEAIAEGLVPLSLQQRYTQPITRAEFASFAVALYENQRGEIAGREAFADTADENVQKAAYIGVVMGVGDGRFDPGGTLTREQAAVMLSRLADAIGQPLPREAATFADNAQISSWALEAVGHVQAAGIMGGVGDNMFDPQGAYTIEQSIVTIMRLFDMLN